MSAKATAALIAFATLLLVGTIGYQVIEGWGPLDSMYMTVITLSTVGYGELHPLTAAGKLFTSGLILFGVGTLAYAATIVTETLIERGLIRRRRMRMEINRVSGHVIVCGYGRMGETVCRQLRERGIELVVVEKSDEQIERIELARILSIVGDATDDESLIAAGIARARALATVLPHDADNLFVTLSARQQRHDLTIVSRASSEKNEAKMFAAGATRVLNPYRNGGRLMARQLLHPSVTEFIDLIQTESSHDLSLEEVQLDTASALVGTKLRDSPIRRDLDVMVVGVRRQGEALEFNPSGDLVPRSGDVLVVLGRRDNLARLARMAEG